MLVFAYPSSASASFSFIHIYTCCNLPLLFVTLNMRSVVLAMICKYQYLGHSQNLILLLFRRGVVLHLVQNALFNIKSPDYRSPITKSFAYQHLWAPIPSNLLVYMVPPQNPKKECSFLKLEAVQVRGQLPFHRTSSSSLSSITTTIQTPTSPLLASNGVQWIQR